MSERKRSLLLPPSPFPSLKCHTAMALHSEAPDWCFIDPNSMFMVALQHSCSPICSEEWEGELGGVQKLPGLYGASQQAEPEFTPTSALPFSCRKLTLNAQRTFHSAFILQPSLHRLGFPLLAAPSPSLQTLLGYGTREGWAAIPCRCRQHT